MPASNSTRLIILSPAGLHREAWRALLAHQPGITICGAVDDTSQFASLVHPIQPTTLLVDLPTPQPDLARQLKALVPHCGLVFLVQSYDLAQIVALLQAGATGCVSRDDSVGDLCRAIIAAGRDEIVLPSAIASRALTALARGNLTTDSLVEPLSDRETDVIRLLAQGLTNKDIAQTLVLSVRTVEAYLRSIYGKLGVHSRTEAVLWAVKRPDLTGL
jgi:DNA-binding NarL/FixJ family response regulator